MLRPISKTGTKKLLELEHHYKVVELYIWFSHRFTEFVDWEHAEDVLDGLEAEIDQTLDELKIPHFKHQKRQGSKKGARKRRQTKD